MVYTKKLLSGLSILGIVAIAAFALHSHIARVRAARPDQIPAIAPYFPPAPSGPRTSATIPSTQIRTT